MVLRDGQFSLVAWFNDKKPDQLWMDWIKTARPERYELYDLGRDLGQLKDLSSRMPGKVEALSEKMVRLWNDIQEEAPVWPQWKAR
jgi:hypothetical protein